MRHRTTLPSLVFASTTLPELVVVELEVSLHALALPQHAGGGSSGGRGRDGADGGLAVAGDGVTPPSGGAWRVREEEGRRERKDLWLLD